MTITETDLQDNSANEIEDGIEGMIDPFGLPPREMSKIQFKEDGTLEIFRVPDITTGETISSMQPVKKGDVLEVEIYDRDDNTDDSPALLYCQLHDDSMVEIPEAAVEIIETKETP